MADKTGGKFFLIEGVCDGIRRKVSENRDQLPTLSTNITYWGGQDYVKFEVNSEAAEIRDGDWLVLRCPVRTFEDRTYPGPARVVKHLRGGVDVRSGEVVTAGQQAATANGAAKK